MSIESIVQAAMVDLSGVELTMEHIAELTLNMASKLKSQKGVSLSQKIENVKASLRTFVNSREFQDPAAAQKLLNIIDTKVGVTLATELKEPFFKRIVSSMYSLFWSRCSNNTVALMDVSGTVFDSSAAVVSESEVTLSDSSDNVVVVQNEKVIATKQSCSISCCSKNLQVEEPVFTVLEQVVEAIAEPVVEAIEPVVEAVKTSAWCQPKKGKKKAKKNRSEVKEPETVVKPETEAAKEPEVVSELELEAIKEPKPEVVAPENPPEPIHPENLSIYK